MEESYYEAMAETLEVLNLLDEYFLNRIPMSVIKFLELNKSIEYKNHINIDIDLMSQTKKETQNILATLYREYMVTDEEKKEMINEEKKISMQNRENDFRKFKNFAIFKKDKITLHEQIEKKATEKVENLLMVIDSEKWYQRIFRRFKEILGLNLYG